MQNAKDFYNARNISIEVILIIFRVFATDTLVIFLFRDLGLIGR